MLFLTLTWKIRIFPKGPNFVFFFQWFHCSKRQEGLKAKNYYGEVSSLFFIAMQKLSLSTKAIAKPFGNLKNFLFPLAKPNYLLRKAISFFITMQKLSLFTKQNLLPIYSNFLNSHLRKTFSHYLCVILQDTFSSQGWPT